MRVLDLVVHDWLNLSTEERRTAINDIEKLSTSLGEARPDTPEGRRVRAINIVESLLYFLTKETTGEDLK